MIDALVAFTALYQQVAAHRKIFDLEDIS